MIPKSDKVSKAVRYVTLLPKMNPNKIPPYKNIIDSVFKEDYIPAAYRWVNAMQPETLQLFKNVFDRLSRDLNDQPDLEKKTQKSQLMASRYTIPEWKIMPINEVPKDTEDQDSIETLLKKPTESNLTYTRFTKEQSRVCRGVPTRTRDSDKSQINATENSPAYISRWAARNMKTSYMNDVCRSEFNATLQNKTIQQTVIVYSKGVLSDSAAKRAEKYIDVEPVWTRQFRELCRNLQQSADSTMYRSGFTVVKKPPPGERFVCPKWRDPEPHVTEGKKRPAESFWGSEMKTEYKPLVKPEETFKSDDQHRARYSCPFDHHAITESVFTTSMRDDFPDHLAAKEEHPLYFEDMKVTMPSGTAAVGEIVGVGGKRGY